MFGQDKRRKRKRFLQVEVEVSAIQRYLFDWTRKESVNDGLGQFAAFTIPVIRLRTVEIPSPDESEPEPELKESDQETPIDNRHNVNVVPPPTPSGGPQGDTWQIT